VLNGKDIADLIRSKFEATVPGPFNREGFPPQASRAARATLYRFAGRLAEWLETNGWPGEAKPLREFESEAWANA
jgi:hypothetical protein